jgi:hypothetical protein
MCRSRTFLGSVLALACMSAIAMLAAAQQPTAKQPPKAPEGWVVVEEDVLNVFTDEPEHYMKAAHDSFLKKDKKATAVELRKAAAFVKLEAARAAGDAKTGLTASATELEKLADDVDKGTVASVEKLDSAFARAAHALANHHRKKAEESWTRKEVRQAGYSLKAAAEYVEHGTKWAGKEVETGGAEVLKGAREISGKLIEGSGWEGEEVGKAIKACGQETEKLGKQIEPTRKP